MLFPSDRFRSTATCSAARNWKPQRRWGEALAHYEEGLRQFPEENVLEKRFELARLHYDLGRRYADRSFAENVSRMPAEKALELYLQVLLKIETHYVEQPAWKDLVDRGTSDLETALGEPVFLQRNLPSRNPAAVEAFRRELRQTLAERSVASRMEARDSAVAAANLAQQRLGLSPTVVILEYLCGATNSLDPYSAYLTPDQLGEVYSQIDGSFVGLGIELKAQGGVLVIVRVISGSPAEQAGVRAGDRIIAVDGRQTSQYTTDQAANLLQGPEGSVCNLVLAAPGEADRQLAVRRQRVEVPSVDQVRIIDEKQGVGYLRLTCFQKTTRRDLEAALWRLHREGMRSLIMDLRGNPGGLLISSVDIADLFLDQGVIVSTHGRIAQEDSTYTAHRRRHVARAVDGHHRSGKRQRRRDLFGSDPRSPPRHDCRRAELRQGFRAGDLPTRRLGLGPAADDGEVLFAQGQALQPRGRRAGRRGSPGGPADQRRGRRQGRRHARRRLADRAERGPAAVTWSAVIRYRLNAE